MTAISALLTLMLAACHGDTALNTITRDTTPGEGVWQLQSGSIDSRAITPPPGVRMTLQSSNGEISGYGGVNQYRVSADIDVDGNAMRIDRDIITTVMAGEVATMRAESDYLSALRRVESYERKDDRLTLSGSGVELHFVSVGGLSAP